MYGPIPPGGTPQYGHGVAPGGPQPIPGEHPGYPGHFGNPEMRTPATTRSSYQTPGFGHPGYANPGGFRVSGASGHPNSDSHAAPTSGSYRRWTPGSTAGGVHPNHANGGSGNNNFNPRYATGPPQFGAYPGGPNVPGTAPSGVPGMRVPNGFSQNSSVPSSAPFRETSRPQSAGAPSYDVVHLSARNARLEEKLSKALSKNRSMAKYYDTLLAKTRDAQEREVEQLKHEIDRVTRNALEGGVAGSASAKELLEERQRRQQLQRELEHVKRDISSKDEHTSELNGNTAAALRVATEQLGIRDAELAALRRRIADSNNQTALGENPVGGFGGVNGGTQTLTTMRDLLDQAREERTRERQDAEKRDREMAKQLTNIKEQALERIKESVAAAREVATLKERVHASELERDRLRDRCQELEHDEMDHRELRRMAQDAEQAAKNAREKADRCELAEARLRQEQAHVASLRDERAQAHQRTQEMTERMLSVTNEKDVLVRHSARTVHIEAELGNCKEELARLRKLGIGTTAEAKTETGVWRDGAEGLGRVLRSYIYGHTRWEKLVSDEFAGAVDAHEHGQRSTVRLVAAAEREAAGLAGEAIEVLRATRQLLSEYGQECAATVDTIKRTVTRNADERVNAALDKLHVAEQRATLAEKEASLSAAEARRARGGEKNALALLDRQKGQIGSARGAVPTSGTTSGKSSNTSTLDTPGVTNESLADPEETASANTEHGTFRRQLRACQFQMVGLAMWKKALGADGERDAQFSRGQVELARRETRVAMARLAQIEKAVDTAGSSSNTSWGLFARGLARKETKHQSDRFDDLVQAFELSQRKLAASTDERLGATNAAVRAEHEIARLHQVLEQSQRLDLNGPSIKETQLAMETLFHASRNAGALAKQAAEDLFSGDPSYLADTSPPPHSAAAQLESTLTACHDTLLIMGDEDDSAVCLTRQEKERGTGVGLVETSALSSERRAAADSMDTATRAMRARAVEIKAELVAALLDSLAARREVIKAARRPASNGHDDDKHGDENTTGGRFGGVAIGFARAASAASAGTRKTARGSLKFVEETNETAKATDDPLPHVSAAVSEYSDLTEFSLASRRSGPKVVHSPVSKKGLFGKDVSVKKDAPIGKVTPFPSVSTADRSHASLVKARARRADALAQRSLNDASLDEMTAKRSDDGDLRESASRSARSEHDQNRSSDTKQITGWVPPKWDDTPLRKSQKKSQGVSPYAKTTKITRRR